MTFDHQKGKLCKECFPLSDFVFVQGTEVIFKVALCLLSSHEGEIVECDSFESIVDYLKITLPTLAQTQMEETIAKVQGVGARCRFLTRLTAASCGGSSVNGISGFAVGFFCQVMEMDISKQLHAYEVEYHVLQDEMLDAGPLPDDSDRLDKLEKTNAQLKKQNMDLLEKLQVRRRSIKLALLLNILFLHRTTNHFYVVFMILL